ncbi:MAG TPA: cadherin-like domain-containing protein, partial [Chondromyces sp.]|nr:cadherin-like domain-containing protein [Chondromyces sp.]
MRRYELHRTAIAVLALLVLGGAGVGPSTAAAQTIDDFNVAQAELALVAAANNVGDTAASSAAAGLGGERGLLLRLLEKGAGGTVSAEVDAGQLSLSADAGMRGELLLSWDGSDGDPAVLDTAAGLGGVDLTAGGADTGLELLVAAASAAGIEVEIEVHSSPEEASRAALVLPAVAAQASFVVSFENDFVATGSAGAADFSAATAVVLRLRTRGSTLQIDALTAVPPRLLQADATKTDTLIDGDGDGLADPGETVRYTITITNTGAAAAAVTLDDVIDANAELVPGSIAISPVAQRDTYSAVGNVALVVAAPGVLANDSDPDGGAVAVDSASLSLTTAQGGAVELAVDGGFTYTPPTGFTGVDSFDYAIVDGDTPERTATGTAAVVVEGRVWFVDNSHAGPFAGTQADPFETLAQVQAASLPGDVIRVRLGDDTYGGGLQLTAGQQLVGGGVDLVLGGQTIEAAGGAPTLANAGGHVIALADDVVVAGVTLTSTAGAALAGNGSGGNVLVDTVDIRPSASGGGLDLAGQTGSFTFASSSIASPAMTTTTGTALRIAGGSADLDFTQGSSLALAGGRLLDVSGFAGTLDLRGTAPTLAAGSGTAITLVGNAGAIFTFDIIGDIGVAAGGGGLVVSSSGTVNLDSVG